MTLNKKALLRNFNKAAATYTQHAVLQRDVSERLLKRLRLLSIKPQFILDLGSGVGDSARRLAGIYKHARVLQMDLSLAMLRRARASSPRFFSRQHYVCGDLVFLPLHAHVADLLFSNLALQWCGDLDALLKQLVNALKPRGALLFTTLGPDTLKELRASWAEVDNEVHVNTFIDMHEIGDALLRAGFNEPVLDVEFITMRYRDVYALMHDLRAVGAGNVDNARVKGLTGKQKIRKLLNVYERYRVAEWLPASYEIIYGIAWAPQLINTKFESEVHIPLPSLRKTQ